MNAPTRRATPLMLRSRIRLTSRDPVAGLFAELALRLSGASGVQETADRVVEFAHDRLGWEMASVLLTDRRTGLVETTAAHGQILEKADQLQLETRQGPALDVARAENTDAVVVHRPAADRRWPTWGAHADQAGVRNLVAVELRTRRPTVNGVLELCSPHRSAARNDVPIARICALHAAVALENARTEHDLHVAADAHSTVGRAEGMLMERFGIASEDALDLLTRLSRDTNATVTVIAQQLSETRQVTDLPSAAQIGLRPATPLRR